MQQGRRKDRPGRWEAFAAAVCFFGGILAALVGSLLTAATWALGADLHPGLRAVGTILLVITIPLLIFAGYCLDWMERKVKSHSTKKFEGK
jgi:hypothetical protein